MTLFVSYFLHSELMASVYLLALMQFGKDYTARKCRFPRTVHSMVTRTMLEFFIQSNC